ncbi:anaerobic dehydrogenase, typically selenocysteine-containing [Desulfitobacterium dehalogenans ATCC 51507]|uniref:Anaerobic dehydrogenase, typically selenocysteine-containing n=1 Tax=Desulfitobacterium dehalogenans (strain ATCC 51507 / DSM 9161 / JW/IU-DC1) TaxID=756499 RepID=I4AE09_DESDJ|nr:molybdopterin-dependent oxidoreductase [Desulfitobacterium dehalogenans]AFM02194.1 anaerobic dehydrogenase, typically selenocysteine-containing [Desulfitobacterium dehalogenans ATCC 51507]
MNTDRQIFHNVCPRNCYETCGILSTVENGKLIKVEGNPKHGYTHGRLCAKGYAYTEYVYSPQRLKYPLRQFPRGSGNWQRISWSEALETIALKIIELHDRYGSNLASGYDKYSGNLGILHYATEGMFRGLGSHTKIHGDLCLSAGGDALNYNRGQGALCDPEDMAKAKGIVLWGVNPARTAVHQWSFINRARDKGAKLLVIDTLFTPTAAQGDIYLQIQPGTDGLLAMAVLKYIWQESRLDLDFIQRHVHGWEAFESYLRDEVSLEEASAITGVPLEGIKDLAEMYLESPCATWVGFGVQRYSNGGQSVRGIDALVTLTKNQHQQGGGLYYYNWLDIFPFNIKNFPLPPEQEKAPVRSLNIIHFAQEALALKDPPLKLLWLASHNPFSQGQNLQHWRKLVSQLELIVVVDLFMNETTAQADIVLPAASPFEEYDLHSSYWHQWIAINQKAIPPFYEARSDLEIARNLTQVLNGLRPDFSSFPWQLSALDWIKAELTPEILKQLEIDNWEELLQGPRKYKLKGVSREVQGYPTETGKFQLMSRGAKENQLPALVRFKEQRIESPYPLRLLTPQSLLRLHSQYRELSWLNLEQEMDAVELNPQDAEQRNLKEKDHVIVLNDRGSCFRRVEINPYIPQGVVVMAQGDTTNQLLAGQNTDMGIHTTGARGAAFYDSWVEVKKK